MNTPSEIATAGGAYVRRTFTLGKREMRSGDRLTAEQLAAIPIANRRALLNVGKIELYPLAPAGALAAEGLKGKIENFMIHVGKGEYIVVRGVKLTAKPVSREQADELAKTATH